MTDLSQKNRKVAFGVMIAVCAMIGLSFASVPLYNMFCAVTGYGGTTGTAQNAPDKISERTITINFDGNTASTLPWEFAPEIASVKTHPGQKTLVSFRAKSLAAAPTTGTALYNVSPAKAGKYFRKIECFCFGEQTLAGGQETDMPVLFFVDPEIDNDPGMKDVTTITLSYTFFKAETRELDNALEDFYNKPAPEQKDGAS